MTDPQRRKMFRNRLFRTVAVAALAGSFMVGGASVTPTAASASEKAPTSVAVETGNSAAAVSPGCNSTAPPPQSFFFLQHYTGQDPCLDCNESAWFYYRQGYWTYCWELSDYHAELWLKVR
jgi:hypothetical protein